MAVAQMMPGPLAAQLAMWFGYLHAGWRGAAAVAAPFVLVPFAIVTAVAVLYAEYQGLAWVHDIFRGVGPAVLAIIAIAAYKLGRSTNKFDPVLWIIGLVLCAATAISGAEIVVVVPARRRLRRDLLRRWPPPSRQRARQRLARRAARGRPRLRLDRLGRRRSARSRWFFIKAGAFTFGSGLAIVPFLQSGPVDEHRWLTEQQFVDAVAMGLISPGPVVIMATFAGYLVFGIARRRRRHARRLPPRLPARRHPRPAHPPPRAPSPPPRLHQRRHRRSRRRHRRRRHRHRRPSDRGRVVRRDRGRRARRAPSAPRQDHRACIDRRRRADRARRIQLRDEGRLAAAVCTLSAQSRAKHPPRSAQKRRSRALAGLSAIPPGGRKSNPVAMIAGEAISLSR